MRWAPFFVVAIGVVGCQDKAAPPVADAPPPNVGPVPVRSGTPSTVAVEAVSGMIQGKAFSPDQVLLEGGRLEFRVGKDFFADALISIDLQHKYGESLASKSWKFDGQFEGPTVIVSARVNKDDLPKTEFVFGTDHSIELTITRADKKEIEGTIDLKPKKMANTYLKGAFKAQIKKSSTDPLDEEDAPYIAGKITFVGDAPELSTSVGFVGIDADGKQRSNEAGYAIGSKSSGGHVTSATFAPQLSSLIGEKSGASYRHVHLTPGDYLTYVRRDKVMAAWKVVKVKAGERLTIDFELDATKGAEVVVTLPEVEAQDESKWDVSLIPVAKELPPITSHFAFQAAETKVGQTQVTIKGVVPGKYRVVRGRSEAELEVVAGKVNTVTLVRAK